MLLRLNRPRLWILTCLLILMFSQSICSTTRSTDGFPCLLGTYLQRKVGMSRFCSEIHCTRFVPYLYE